MIMLWCRYEPEVRAFRRDRNSLLFPGKSEADSQP